MIKKVGLLVMAIATISACGTPGLGKPDSSSSSSSSDSSSSSSAVSSSSSSSSVVSSSSSSQPSSSSSSESSSSSSVNPGVGLVFEDGFENGNVGQFPGAPWKTRIGFNTSSTDTSLLHITDDAYSGSKAVEITSSGPFNPTFMFLDFAEQTKQADHLYVRMYLKASAGLGGDGGHAHIIELSKDGQNGIRYGEANGSIGVNTVEGGDPLSPQPNQADEDLAANQWYCLEVLFDKRPEYDELTTWVDGSIVHKVSNEEGQWGDIWTNNGPAANWLENAFNDQIQFGWYAFSGVRGNTIIFDDIVISTEMVGCNYLPTGPRGDGVQ